MYKPPVRRFNKPFGLFTGRTQEFRFGFRPISVYNSGIIPIAVKKLPYAFSAKRLGITAFVVSLAVVKALMNYVKRKDFKVFGYYRITLGAVILIYYAVLSRI
jgi:undecaprenyl-diphosphatase